MNSKCISVIMSCYNEKNKWLKESIESILKQTYKNFEFIIIIDNPNNKDIVTLVDKYSKIDNRIKYFVNEVNVGLVKSLNRALEYSTGEFIARMDADDISSYDRLEKQLDFMIKNPDVGLIGSCIEIIDEYGNIKGRRSKLPNNCADVDKILPITNFFNHPTWFVRREIYIYLKGYREINRNEDYDFLLRAITSNYKLSNLNEYLLKYRIRESSISRTNPLEQYIATIYSKKLYNERKKNICDSYNQKAFNTFISEKCNERNIKKYNISCKYYDKGIDLIKHNKKLKGIIFIVRSLNKSKYNLFRFIEYIQYKFRTYRII